MNPINEVVTYVPRMNLTEVAHYPEAKGIVEGSTEVTVDLEKKDGKDESAKPVH